jgi:hypothetical protein
MMRSIMERIAPVHDPWERLVQGIRAFVEACLDRGLPARVTPAATRGELSL